MLHTKNIGIGLTVLLVSGTLAIGRKSYAQTATTRFRLVISFISPGDGIDYKAKKEIDESISSYEKEKGVRLAREEISWGREGELDYCFKLSELSKEDQVDVVSRIKPLVKKSKRTSIVENAPCGNKRPQ